MREVVLHFCKTGGTLGQGRSIGWEMDWDDLRYFSKVAETGSLLSAAKFLRVNVATVGRHIERLENELGRALFNRTQQGYRLNEDGVALARWAQRMQGEFARLPALFQRKRDAAEGPVSLATTEPLANCFVVPLMPALLKLHPGIVLDIGAEVRSVNLSRRESEIALRLGKLPRGNLRTRRLGELGFGFFASPAYLKKRGTPDPAQGFAGHDLISWPAADPYGDWLRQAAPHARMVLRSSSGQTRMIAAQAGIGIALLPCFMVDRRSGLRRVVEELQAPMTDLLLIVHAELSQKPAIRAVLDFLADAARAQRDRLRGES